VEKIKITIALGDLERSRDGLKCAMALLRGRDVEAAAVAELWLAIGAAARRREHRGLASKP